MLLNQLVAKYHAIGLSFNASSLWTYIEQLQSNETLDVMWLNGDVEHIGPSVSIYNIK